MDVENIQKINSLALNLMKQGLATDREDAVRQAERAYQDKSEGYTEIIGRMQEIKNQQPKLKKGVADLSQDEIKTILDQNTKFLIKTIKGFQEKVECLEKEVSNLKTKMAYERLPTVKEIRDEVPSVVESQMSKSEINTQGKVYSQPVPQAPPSSGNNSQQTRSHPRSGVFSQEDVSIEKMFYMGKK